MYTWLLGSFATLPQSALLLGSQQILQKKAQRKAVLPNSW